MTKCFKIFSFLFVLALINSCASQTNVINSLSKVKKSILKIETWASLSDCDASITSCPLDQILSTGTGAVVLHNNKKHILTAAHICVQDDIGLPKEFKFYFKARDQNDKLYIISIVNYDKKSDVCLMKSVSGDLEPAFIPLAPKNLDYGEQAYNLAAPMGIIEKGMVPVFEGKYFGIHEGNAFYSIPAIGGSSGSPVVNSRGELVGMIHSVHFRFHHVTLSATYHKLWNFLNVEKVHIIQVLN